MRTYKCIFYFISTILLIATPAIGQNHNVSIQANLDPISQILSIEQEITYKNTSEHTLQHILFHDWANSFSNKTTPLGKRFSEDFKKKFHLAKESQRGFTTIESITDTNSNILKWERHEGKSDILNITPTKPLKPNDHYTFKLQYKVKIPSSKFTRYGYDTNGNFNLRYWHIVPAVYGEKWETYSNKNLNDLYAPAIDYTINLTIPKEYKLFTELSQNEASVSENGKTRQIILEGKKRNGLHLYIQKTNSFYNFKTGNLNLISDIEDNGLMPKMKAVATDRIINFLNKNLGEFPFEKILVSQNDYKNNPVYGFNQIKLPDILDPIIRPFPDGFQYEIKQLKSITNKYLEKTLLINPRYDAWIKDGIQIYLMMNYIEQYYPNIKVIGNFSEIIGIRWLHAADIKFNDRYYHGYKNIARLFLDQSLATPQDQLIKFNKNIANAFKTGIGFKYLEDYLENGDIILKSIQEFYNQFQLKPSNSKEYKKILNQLSPKNVDWFFNDYINTNQKLDFKFKSVKKRKDSIEVTIKNTQNNTMPISLVGLKDDQIVSKTWVSNINGTKTVKIVNQNIEKLVLDYEQNVPEVNRRNNYKNLKWIMNRPIQFRFLQDIEDPRYSQVFFIPEFEYNNIYDGFSIGSKFYNKTFTKKQFEYKITPSYGFKSQKILGSASFLYKHQLADHGLYQIRYHLSGNASSYAPDLLVKKFTPSVNFVFRPEDLRSNESQILAIRSVNVFRDRNIENPVNTPDYSVLNVRYRFSDPNLTHLASYIIDYQISKNFSKLSTTINYRKLFLNNRQLNLRLFAGTFLFNETQRDKNFFSFALDRPSDYLFDYNYLGRSEDTGLISQQIIPAEGGFKSKLDSPYANKWITTLNANTNIWKWIYAYGDLGFVKNKNIAPKFVFDAGVRLSLVADYFEVFFPIVSNKGWETSLPDYNERIRFIITLSPQTLIRLFTREWY